MPGLDLRVLVLERRLGKGLGPISAFAWTLLDDPSAAAMRQTLGVPAYETGTFAITATGMTTTVSGTAQYVKMGRQVTLGLPKLTGTSNATTMTLTGLPVGLNPDPAIGGKVLVRTTDNGLITTGVLALSIPPINVYRNVAGQAWSATGEKTLWDCW